MRRLVLALLGLVAISAAPAADPPAAPRLGEPLSAEQLAGYDTVIFPDGRGLPGGSGTVEDGRRLYQQHCLVCHGKRGRGGSGDELAGGIADLTRDPPDRTIGTYWPYATTLFDFIRRAMPMHRPGSLSTDETYALTAYLLFVNGVIEQTVTLDRETLPGVSMPNRDGFIWIDVNEHGDLRPPDRD